MIIALLLGWSVFATANLTVMLDEFLLQILTVATLNVVTGTKYIGVYVTADKAADPNIPFAIF